MKRKDLARTFYSMVLIKERERTGYAIPGKIWSNGEPAFSEDFIAHVVRLSMELADQFLEAEKRVAVDDWMNDEI
jgi:hypothetical protein